MYKKLINKHLSGRLLNEEAKHNGLATTEKVQKEDDKVNKAAYKEVEKKMKDYDGSLTQEDEGAIDAPKTNIEGETKDFHDEMEIRNGQEMLKYDNEPSDSFKDRAEMALAGDSKMGNDTKEGEWNPETGEGNGNTEEVWGSSGGKNTGEEIIKQVKASAKKRNDAEYNLIQLGDDIEQSGTDKTRGKSRKVAVETKINNNQPLNETKMKKKRLRFKKAFDGLGNALQLIPEAYKVDSKEFEMTDGNETYDIRWEGSLTEGKAVVVKAEDANMVNEDIQKMKHLMGYKSQDTLGTLKGEARITENNDNSFRTMLDKTRGLMTESVEAVEETENIEGQKASVDNSVWDDAAPKGDNHADHIMEDEVTESEDTVEETENIEGQKASVVTEEDEVTESEDTVEETEKKKTKLIENIEKLMEETGLTEEELIEGFFSGPSKEEQSKNQQALQQQMQQMAADAEAKNWKVGYLFDRQNINGPEELMKIAAKNKFRGKIMPRPIKAKGTFYIEYQKGLTGLQKMAGGAGAMTSGQ